MAEWRDSILKNFQKHSARLTLVADPDGLLTEERMLAAIKDRGFDLIPFDDPIAFRFAKEFALMHCFGIVPKLIKTPVDLLKMLLSLHSRQVHLPTILSEYLIESLGKEKAIKKWPLCEILPDRGAFLRFLQVEWAAFVASGGAASAKGKVPFSHEDVRAYIDTLFLDGLLSPVPVEDVSSLPNWMRTGVLHDIRTDAIRRYRLLRERFEATADHGNVTATGIGIPKEGVLAETKGQRVRVYDRADFREEVATKFPESLRWPGYGLPPGRHVLVAGDLKAFTNEGERIVAHGGISLEEVLVPFVAIGRDDS